MYTPKAVLSIRAMQHLLTLGWPNKGLYRTKQTEFRQIQDAFTQETGRNMTAKDLKYKGELPHGY